MDELRAAVLRLLEREPPPGPVMAEDIFVADSLAGHIERLGRERTPVTAGGLASLCLAYAHAYVHPERLGEVVSLEDATLLAGRFARRRGGCRALAGQDALRRVLLHHGFALQMLFDIPKTVHLLDALLRCAVAPGAGDFVGLDLGSGTGILLLGQYLLARRLGHDAPRLTGVEHLPQVAARADALLATLGVGRVVSGDATTSAIYNDVPQGNIACVTNETLPSCGRRLYKEPFAAINAALFAALGQRLGHAAFLPEAVWVSDRGGRNWLRLAPENAFAGDASPMPARLFYMRDVELGGERIPADQVGASFHALVSPVWAAALGRRW
ncbi:MAG: hypothetical protein AB7D37_05120 [Desulfovibrio sp.]